MAKFVHRGVNISLRTDGMFQAKIGNKSLCRGTLKSVKADIDELTKNAAFKPFWGIRGYWKGKFNRVRVVGRLTRLSDYSRRRGGKTTVFVCKDGYDEHTYQYEKLYVDTPANRAALKKAEAFKEKSYRLSFLRNNRERKMFDKLAVVTPNSVP